MRVALLLAGLAVAGSAHAEFPAECQVAEPQIERSFPLPHVAEAIKAKKLDVLVIGAGSSTLPGSAAKAAYPARLQRALAGALSGVVVTVTTDVKSRRTAADMVGALAQLLATAKPQLVVWQTGTVDAMLAVDTDQFTQALDRGIAMARAAGADVVLVNGQYSPRTESMIALGTYVENMRWVAVQHEVPVFDRFSIMRLWADLGTFDFTSARNKLDTAERVHDCIGRLLAELVIEAAKPAVP
jgi:hypothetical protein